jgi:hypothetical protein
MGKFAETEIVNYRLSFSDPGKQTSVYRFRLQQTNRQKFAVPVFHL